MVQKPLLQFAVGLSGGIIGLGFMRLSSSMPVTDPMGDFPFFYAGVLLLFLGVARLCNA